MKPATVITTRPLIDAREDCAELAKAGINGLPAPMLDIHPLDAELSEGEAADAVVLTSRHAAGLITSAPVLALPCYCVGSSTAAAATSAGFTNVITGPGDGAGLSARIAEDKPGTVFWPSAVDTGFNMAGALQDHGITTIQVAVYKAATTDDFPPDVLAALSAGQVTAVLMHSGRAGAHFHALMRCHGLDAEMRRITAIVISPRAAGLCGEGWRNIIAVDTPQRMAMFDAVRRVVDEG